MVTAFGNGSPQTQGLLATSVCKSHEGSMVRIIGLDMIPFAMPHQEVDPIIVLYRLEKVRRTYKIVHVQTLIKKPDQSRDNF